ncbi:hypothetical protein UY3_11357 [Chelonia mydas]|uniref:Uncharacterized protein n=1 Tax=Chelonia mydas TaxID=8469 RepID=M7BHI1_CHEMY|nr:hypothetical protein UY3_11357 [Chelonia mydas]
MEPAQITVAVMSTVNTMRVIQQYMQNQNLKKQLTPEVLVTVAKAQPNSGTKIAKQGRYFFKKDDFGYILNLPFLQHHLLKFYDLLKKEALPSSDPRPPPSLQMNTTNVCDKRPFTAEELKDSLGVCHSHGSLSLPGLIVILLL